MIFATSRYATWPVVTVTGPAGTPVAVIASPEPVTNTFSYISYQLSQGDRVDLLGYKFFGDPTQWWQIANANPEVDPGLWGDIDALVAMNTVIRIPYTG